MSWQKWSKEEIDLLKKLYPESTKAETLRAFPRRTYIATKHKANKLKIRKRKITRSRVKGQYRKVNGEKVIAVYDRGFSIRAIAEELGVCHHTISSRLRELGVYVPNKLEKRKPTRPESRFIHICERKNLTFRYVGNGAFWIENLNPDFVESNGKKIAVEIFSDYWHNPLLNRRITPIMLYNSRKKILEKYGWKCIIFWESEIMSTKAEDVVLKRLT